MRANAELEIRQLIVDQQLAVRAKDVDRIMAHYAPSVVVYNVKPPLQIMGKKDWRRVWEESFAHFPGSFGVEMRDLTITCGGDLGLAHYQMRFTGMPGVQPWLRNTAVYKRDQDKCLIIHEHCSVPFDPESSKAVFQTE